VSRRFAVDSSGPGVFRGTAADAAPANRPTAAINPARAIPNRMIQGLHTMARRNRFPEGSARLANIVTAASIGG
jgi:hypothetical protein